MPGALDPAAALQSMREAGLLVKLLPSRSHKRGGGASFTSLVAALEGLAMGAPLAAAALAQAVIGTVPVAQLGSARQKAASLDALVHGDGAAPVLLRNADAGADEAPMRVALQQGDWLLEGGGRWGAAGVEAPAFVVFASHRQANGESGQASAFIIPRFAAGVSVHATSGPAGMASEGTLQMQVLADGSLLLGPAGQAASVMAATFALDRLASAAQASGLAIAAYEEASKTLGLAGSDAQEAERSSLKLAHCATAISAARMMLYEAARAADSGEDIRLASAKALLCAMECAERMLNLTVQVVGGHPSVDAARMHQFLAARRLQQSVAGPAERQAARIARAIVQPSISSRGDEPLMPKATTEPRTPEMPDRVSEILDAAADAFDQQGYDATTLDHIGDALGVTKGSIYYHYRSKVELFVAVYRRVMEMNLETISPIAEDEALLPLERLYRMAHAHSLQVMKHLSYQRLAVHGIEAQLMGRVNEDQRAKLNEVIVLRDRYQEIFVRAISQAVEAGELPQQDARMAVKPLFGALNCTTMWYQPRPGETAADRERIGDQLAGFAISGLTQSYRSDNVPTSRPTAAPQRARRSAKAH
ncbi:TetR family transcriptional regulator [Ramlibacter tataouinensis]|uniref:TetR family transcriptional regulator n=1 Tax=Ramlibacter tataouinensis TaxID=94132 RepID=UPI0022F3CAD1|nr:TetR family transcriptional regulator [Ramlibacter tataouinensis]WBY01334.1 TetR family transcriptional regulator [Ramlibacter tataouinensis]